MNSIQGIYTAIPSLGLGDRLESLRLDGVRGRFANMKGPRDFFDVKRMSKPQGWGDAQGRIGFNVRYFSSNYTVILLMFCLYSLLTNLLLLFVLVFAAVGMVAINALQGGDLVLPWGSVITSQNLYIALGIITVPLFIIASPLSTLFWLVGAAGVTILGHAALMEKPLESEFDDQV